MLANYKVDIPEGTSGDWQVKQFEVSAKDADYESLRAVITGRGRAVPAGHYTGLYQGGSLWMSDTPDEIADHLPPVRKAKGLGGHILVNGLGLGMVTAALLNMDNVTKVTVIENSEDVLALVGPPLQERYGDRLEIIQADAYEHKPPKGERYSVVWHDVWLHLCTDNLKEMAKLHRKYGRRCDWQGSWGKGLCQSYRKRERR